MKTKLFSRGFLWSDTAILIYLALVKVLIHLLTAKSYGYFGDELYTFAAARHLDFGYVDIPPLVPFLAALSRLLIGASLFAIHVLPAIVGGVMVFFAGRLAKELGGGRFAQWFTALMVIVAPFWLAENSFFTYEPFDQLCVVLVYYMIARIIKQETRKEWIILGLIIGLGIMTKLSMVFTVFGLVVALILTSRRKSLITGWPWLAALIAIAICVPYGIWQWTHGWPLLKYWSNYAMYRPHNEWLDYLHYQTLELHPLTLPIWLLGLFYLLFRREGKQFRIIGIMHLVILIVFAGLMKVECRLIASAYFPLLAAGAVFLEQMITPSEAQARTGGRAYWNWLKPVYTGILLVSCVILAPNSLPVLPIPALEQYLATTANPWTSINYPGELPFQFEFELGWPEMVKTIADVYHSLPKADRKKCVIYASDYPEAAAIDLLGEKYGLPHAISNHLSYQVWGPGKATGEVAIVFGKGYFYQTFTSIWLSGIFEEVEHAAIIPGHKYSARFERGLPVFVCRKPKMSLKKVWTMFEDYH